MTPITKFGKIVEIEPKEGRKILKAAPIRVIDVPAVSGWIGQYNEPEIQYEGEWLDLCRTDLCDDVATGLCATKTAEGWRKHYLSCIVLGVRISTEPDRPGRGLFACIDQGTDG